MKEVPPKKEVNQQIVKRSLLVDFFDPAHLKETFLVAFKSKEKHRRLKIFALMAVIIIVMGPQQSNPLEIIFKLIFHVE